jgi:hypothetical protein
MNAGNDLSDPLWYQRVPGLAGTVIKPTLLATKSNYFQITAAGKKNEMTRQINGIVKKLTGRKAYQILSWRQE